MTILNLSAMCLVLTAVHLNVAESHMCDDGWVYHLDTSSCLRVIKEGYRPRFWELENINPCSHTQGGEFRNISGTIVTLTESTEPFLRDYFQSLNVTAAVVEVSLVWFAWPSSAVFHRRIFLSRHEARVKQRTYFVPGRRIPFTQYPTSAPAVICQVPAGPIEPAVCPRDVKLVSVFERNVTLSWIPGQLGRKADVNIKVQICDDGNFSCDDIANRTFSNGSLFQSTNYTVTELQPKTKYKLVVQILNDNSATEDCNDTLVITTNEEYTVAPVSMSRKEEEQEFSGTFVGLSSALVICFCICLVLAVLLFKQSRRFKDRNSDTVNAAKDRQSDIDCKPEVQPQEPKNQGPSENIYLNDQQMPPNYDKTTVQDDDHIYEMTE